MFKFNQIHRGNIWKPQLLCPAMPLKLLPREVSSDLKWLAWNDIWTAVNSKLASASDQSEDLRQRRRRQGEEDERRAEEHLQKILKTEVLQEVTVNHFRDQIKVVAKACASAALEGKWLGAAKAQVLDAPDEFESRTWFELVKAIKSAGVAVILLSHDELQKAEALRRDFEDAWIMFSEKANLAE